MSCACGCCDGVRAKTPADTYNPPGQTAIRYRIGTHGEFRESMQARLSAQSALRGLTTRDPSDPSIALLDVFALIADILSFYQERIANEGYLRTATEPLSLSELGKLVGYRPRPALGSSTYLAYTLDPGSTTLIPAGSAARSVPRQNEVSQTFETSDDLEARQDWNALEPAMTNPVSITDYGKETDLPDDVRTIASLGVAGTANNLNAGDRLLFLFGSRPTAVVRVVSGSTADFTANKTVVSLAPRRNPLRLARGALLAAVSAARKTAVPGDTVTEVDSRYLDRLEARLKSRAPLTADQIFTNVLGGSAGVSLSAVLDRLAEARALASVHGSRTVVGWYDTRIRAVLDAGRQLVHVAEALTQRAPGELVALQALAHEMLCPPTLSRATARNDCDAGAGVAALTAVLPWLRRPPSRPPRKARDAIATIPQLYRPDSDVHARLLAAADPRLAPDLARALANERLAPPPTLARLEVFRTKAHVAEDSDNETTVVTLDTTYDGILEGSWVEIGGVVRRVRTVREGSRQEATIDIPCTVLTLNAAVSVSKGDPLYARAEELAPVGDPITDDIGGDEIELSRVYDGLLPGRLLAVAGERTDVPFTTGIPAAEVVMVAGVRQRIDPDKRGVPVRTLLHLTGELSYTYRRDTVTVYGNVVEATQGATRHEILGSGDASVPNQSFLVRQVNAENPLTALPANTPDGAEDTLDVAVSGVSWQPAEILATADATDHVYATLVGGENSVGVQFGDGTHGARPQTGVENITATFRVGAGPSGNVVAGQVSQLGSQPLGVNAVTNPIPATGGADGDSPADMRATTPLRMLALDRLLSVRDYEDFTRARAGIGKANARKLFDGQQRVVHVTIAGVGDAPIDPVSELFTNTEESLVEFGDIGMPVALAVRELVLLVLRAGIKVAPHHSWDRVEPAARAALLDAFSFRRRVLGQDVYLSEAVAAMQSVPGVDYVDVDVFHGVPATVVPIDLVTLSDQLTAPRRVLRAGPAELVEHVAEVAAGETLTQFALRLGIGIDDLCRLNPTLVDAEVAEGDALVVRKGIRPARIALLPAGVPEALTLWRIR